MKTFQHAIHGLFSAMTLVVPFQHSHPFSAGTFANVGIKGMGEGI
jgi:hypothetical protein